MSKSCARHYGFRYVHAIETLLDHGLLDEALACDGSDRAVAAGRPLPFGGERHKLNPPAGVSPPRDLIRAFTLALDVR
jgi:hypothetical protein